MITGVSVVTVLTRDQEAAHRFFTEKLGFQTRTDFRMGPQGQRWLSVVPPTGQGPEFTLFDPRSWMPSEAAEEMLQLIGKMPGLVLGTRRLPRDHRGPGGQGREDRAAACRGAIRHRGGLRRSGRQQLRADGAAPAVESTRLRPGGHHASQATFWGAHQSLDAAEAERLLVFGQTHPRERAHESGGLHPPDCIDRSVDIRTLHGRLDFSNWRRSSASLARDAWRTCWKPSFSRTRIGAPVAPALVPLKARLAR